MSPRQPLKRFVVRFQDWTSYRLEVDARDADHAIALAQGMSTGDLWEAEAIDGGQEHWEAFPMAEPGAGAP
jgi:hypothetical protein